jgi:hypothetical protein
MLSATSPSSIASNRYFHASSGRLSMSLYSITPPWPSTSSPCVSNSATEPSAAGRSPSERSAVIWRSLASTLICGPIVTAPVR